MPGLLSGTVLFKGVPFRLDSQDPNNPLGFFVTVLENTPTGYENDTVSLSCALDGSITHGTTSVNIDNSGGTNPATGFYNGGSVTAPAQFAWANLIFIGTTGTVLPQGTTATNTATGAQFATGAAVTLASAPAWHFTTQYYNYADAPGHLATQGLVINGGNIYLCITSGITAGSGGPTGTSLNITDGAAHWRYLGAATGFIAYGQVFATAFGAGTNTTYSVSTIVTAVAGLTAVTNPAAAGLESVAFRATVLTYTPTLITFTPAAAGNTTQNLWLRPGGDTGGAGTFGEANSSGWTITYAPSRSGAQLDLLGRIVGMPRAGLDDYTYLAWLNAAVHINCSKGTINDFIAVLTPLLPEGWKFHIHTDLFTGTVVVNLLQQPSAQLLAQLQNVAQLTRAAGIRLILQVSLLERFSFAGGEGLGFNQGRLGSTGAGIVPTGQEFDV